jgi:hypothetical protein
MEKASLREETNAIVSFPGLLHENIQGAGLLVIQFQMTNHGIANGPSYLLRELKGRSEFLPY